ncbi:MAG TPA: response regulator [Mycobacterium sp.]|nr:response regulator [Mycobacterium sp.]
MPSIGVQSDPVMVAVIDDHDVVHAGVEAWCSQADPPIRIVGKFSNPQEFLAAYDHASSGLDVILLDLQIEGRRPDFHLLRRLCDSGERVIVYSHLTADEVILTCLELGAITYLAKTESQRHLIEAIHCANTATPYVAPRMGKALAHDTTLGRLKLSDREKEVLIAWFQTESKELVGKRLYIAPTTVRTHLQRARAKYAGIGRPAPTKAALLARAIEDGILSLNDLY